MHDPSARIERFAQIEADLADVELALGRLDAGTYWTCEITGEPLPDELLCNEPAARRIRPPVAPREASPDALAPHSF